MCGINVATCSAGKKDWMIARPKDKNNFITDILNKIKISTEQRKTGKKDEEEVKKKGAQGFGTRRHH